MIRLVAFDLDGTVLSGLNRASEASIEAIRALVERGVGVASVSGRNVEKSQAPFAAVPDLAAALFIGSYNGAVVLDSAVDGPRRLLREERLPEVEFREVVDYIGANGLNFVYCRCEVGEEGVEEVYMTDRETESVRGLGMLAGMQFVFDTGLISRIGDGELGPSPKLIVMPGKEGRDATLREMQQAFGGRLYMARTGEDRIEIMHLEANKGAALRAIASACGVDLREVLAVGDGDNDLPMLQEAGVGVLVESADEVTREAAREAGARMAPAFEAEGFSKAVYRYVLDA